MPFGSRKIFRPRFIAWNPRTWWDRFFIRTGLAIERLWASWLFRGLLRGVVGLFRAVVWGVSPSSDYHMGTPPNWRRMLLVAMGAALAAYVFSYWLNYASAYFAGTLSGSDQFRRYFLADDANVTIYRFIAPVYIACSCVVIYLYATNATFASGLGIAGGEPRFRSSVRFVLFAALVLGLSGLAQYLYYDQIVTRYDSIDRARKFTDPNHFVVCKSLTYWFVERTNEGLALNNAGIAYFFGNFVRLSIVFAAVFCFVAASASVIRLGMRVTPDGNGSFDADALRRTLFSFSVMELWMKGLYMILSVHSGVWGASCLNGDFSIGFADLLRWFIGYMVLTIPRNFVEFRLWRRMHSRKQIGDDEGLPDLRGAQVTLLYSLLSTAFFISVAIALAAESIGLVAIRPTLDYLRKLFWPGW